MEVENHSPLIECLTLSLKKLTKINMLMNY